MLAPPPGRALRPRVGRRLVSDATVLTTAHAERREGRVVVVVDRQDVWQGRRTTRSDLTRSRRRSEKRSTSTAARCCSTRGSRSIWPSAYAPTASASNRSPSGRPASAAGLTMFGSCATPRSTCRTTRPHARALLGDPARDPRRVRTGSTMTRVRATTTVRSASPSPRRTRSVEYAGQVSFEIPAGTSPAPASSCDGQGPPERPSSLCGGCG